MTQVVDLESSDQYPTFPEIGSTPALAILNPCLSQEIRNNVLACSAEVVSLGTRPGVDFVFSLGEGGIPRLANYFGRNNYLSSPIFGALTIALTCALGTSGTGAYASVLHPNDLVDLAHPSSIEVLCQHICQLANKQMPWLLVPFIQTAVRHFALLVFKRTDNELLCWMIESLVSSQLTVHAQHLANSCGASWQGTFIPFYQSENECGIIAALNTALVIRLLAKPGTTTLNWTNKLADLWQPIQSMDPNAKNCFSQKWRQASQWVFSTLLAKAHDANFRLCRNYAECHFVVRIDQSQSFRPEVGPVPDPSQRNHPPPQSTPIPTPSALPPSIQCKPGYKSLPEAQSVSLSVTNFLAQTKFAPFTSSSSLGIGDLNVLKLIHAAENMNDLAIDILVPFSVGGNLDAARDIFLQTHGTILEPTQNCAESIAAGLLHSAVKHPLVILEGFSMPLLQTTIAKLGNKEVDATVYVIFFCRDAVQLVHRETALAAFVHAYGTYLVANLRTLAVSSLQVSQRLSHESDRPPTMGRVIVASLFTRSNSRFRSRSVLLGGLSPSELRSFIHIITTVEANNAIGNMCRSFRRHQSPISFHYWTTKMLNPATNSRLVVWSIQLQPSSIPEFCRKLRSDVKQSLLIRSIAHQPGAHVIIKSVEPELTRAWLEALGFVSSWLTVEATFCPIQPTVFTVSGTCAEHWATFRDQLPAVLDNCASTPLACTFVTHDDFTEALVSIPEENMLAPWLLTLPEGLSLHHEHVDFASIIAEGLQPICGNVPIQISTIPSTDHAPSIFAMIPLRAHGQLEKLANSPMGVRISVQLPGKISAEIKLSPHFGNRPSPTARPTVGASKLGLALHELRKLDGDKALRASLPISFVVEGTPSDDANRPTVPLAARHREMRASPGRAYTDKNSNITVQLSQGIGLRKGNRYSLEVNAWDLRMVQDGNDTLPDLDHMDFLNALAECLHTCLTSGTSPANTKAFVFNVSNGRAFTCADQNNSHVAILGSPKAPHEIEIDVQNQAITVGLSSSGSWVMTISADDWLTHQATLKASGNANEIAIFQFAPGSHAPPLPPEDEFSVQAAVHIGFILASWKSELSGEGIYSTALTPASGLPFEEFLGPDLVLDALKTLATLFDNTRDLPANIDITNAFFCIALDLMGITHEPSLLRFISRQAGVISTHPCFASWRSGQDVDPVSFLSLVDSHGVPWRPVQGDAVPSLLEWGRAIDSIRCLDYSAHYTRQQDAREAVHRALDPLLRQMDDEQDEPPEPDVPMAAPPRGPFVKYVAIISLFAGTDSARMGLERYLYDHGLLLSLVACVAIEKSPLVLRELRDFWAPANRQYANTPEPIIVQDVLDWLLQKASPLREFLKKLPQGTVLIVAAGSPCQDFNALAAGQGKLGFHGPRSILVFCVALYLWVISLTRPDVQLVPILENGGGMLSHFARDMPRIVGLRPSNWVLTDTINTWSLFPRKRYFGSPFISAVPKKPADYDIGQGIEPGWFPPTHPAAFMLPRPTIPGDPDPDQFPIASLYQYHPKHLMRHTDVSPDDILGPHLATFPPDAASSLQFLLNHKGMVENRKAFDDLARPWAKYVTLKGREFGLRTPTGKERLTQMGLGAFADKASSERARFALAGNSFHSMAIVFALGDGEVSLHNVLLGKTLVPVLQLPSPLQLSELKAMNLVECALEGALAPKAHKNPFPYCPEYQSIESSVITKSDPPDPLEDLAHVHRIINFAPKPNNHTHSLTPYNPLGVDGFYSTVARFVPLGWCGSLPVCTCSAPTVTSAVLALGLHHSMTREFVGASITSIANFLQDFYQFESCTNLLELQKQYRALSTRAGTHRWPGIVVLQGVASDGAFTLGNEEFHVVLPGSFGVTQTSAASFKDNPTVPIIYMIGDLRYGPVSPDPSSGVPLEPGFAVGVITTRAPNFFVSVKTNSSWIQPPRPWADHLEVTTALTSMNYVALPLKTKMKRGIVTAAMRFLFNDVDVLACWQRTLQTAGDATPRVLRSRAYVQLTEQQKLAVFLDTYITGTRLLLGDEALCDPPHHLLFVDLMTKEGFYSPVKLPRSSNFADFILFLKSAGNFTLYVSLPKSARTASINEKLMEGTRQIGNVKLTPIIAPAPMQADMAGPVTEVDGPSYEFSMDNTPLG